MKRTLTTILVLASLSSVGCVTKGTYDEAVSKTQLTQANLGRTTSALEQSNAEVQRDRDQIALLQSQIDSLWKASQDEQSKASQNIDELRKRLEEQRAARVVADTRALLFHAIAKELQSEVDTGNLQVSVRDGRMVLALSNDVLFDTGSTELKPAGQAALKKIALVLKNVPDRHFQVAGHTDNVPIHNETFPSNWELSAGRALGVVHFLSAQGVPTATLSAAGYADVDPVSSNDKADGRKRNRRTEIAVEPNIQEIIRVP